MTATDIVRALSVKHSGDVFVPECKDGPTHTRSHRRLDAWVLLKTWSPVTAIGYEVKVSRSDWLQDQKVDGYRRLCHLLYIVAPKGIVQASELPDGVGLMECVGASRRVVTRVKAVRNQIELPQDLLVYVLMCRTRVTREDGRTRADMLRDWVAETEERHRLSSYVHEKIQRSFNAANESRRDAERRASRLEHIDARMRELGFDPTVPVGEWEVSRRLNDLSGAVHPQLIKDVTQAEHALRTIRDRLENLTAEKRMGVA